mmetsp:Transcript_52026/g.149212  ORF Transcript_52026/g.149212 Transcript_52026/m.149212 type:complete len:255 (+) Transcript_52026:1707-2471(+)
MPSSLQHFDVKQLSPTPEHSVSSWEARSAVLFAAKASATSTGPAPAPSATSVSLTVVRSPPGCSSCQAATSAAATSGEGGRPSCPKASAGCGRYSMVSFCCSLSCRSSSCQYCGRAAGTASACITAWARISADDVVARPPPLRKATADRSAAAARPAARPRTSLRSQGNAFGARRAFDVAIRGASLPASPAKALSSSSAAVTQSGASLSMVIRLAGGPEDDRVLLHSADSRRAACARARAFESRRSFPTAAPPR